MFPSRTISVSIRCHWRELYEAIWQPEFFPRWASGLSQTTLEKEGGQWKAKGPNGVVRIRFTPKNEFGVMDHWVDTGVGREVCVPMRIIPNEDESEVVFTLFRRPEMTDQDFDADAAWVEKDLKALKSMFDK